LVPQLFSKVKLPGKRSIETLKDVNISVAFREGTERVLKWFGKQIKEDRVITHLFLPREGV